MAVKSYVHGHPVVFVGGFWQYEDTGIHVAPKARTCKKCGEFNDDDFDSCLGKLPGVNNACCGHGIQGNSYIQFTNGITVRGFSVDNSKSEFRVKKSPKGEEMGNNDNQ